MSRVPFAVAGCFLFAALVGAAPAPSDTGPTYIDLAPHANVKLSDNFHSGDFQGNNLAKLPTGKQTFADVKFKVGESLIQLKNGGTVKEKPAKVEGIKVDRLVGKLRFLHGTGYQTDDDTVIAKYVINYDDKTSADVEVAYGRDVVDWWLTADRKEPTKGKVAWSGKNDATADTDTKIQLYLMTWENPHPKKKVVSIDFVATVPDGSAAPFCVAITAEDK
jgi:hypothetical protein